MSKIYVACTVAKNKSETIFEPKNPNNEIGYYAYFIKISENDNIKSVLEGIKDLKSANVFATKKRAKAFVEQTNAGFKENKTYLFDETF